MVDEEDETISSSTKYQNSSPLNSSNLSNNGITGPGGGVVSMGTPTASTSLISHHTVMYAPKCLVLISRLDCAETFKNCLGTIYTVYIENLPYALETLIGNILGCIQVPPAGGPQVRFSIGASDKQSLQPPQSSSLPITGTSVNFLFKQLGELNRNKSNISRHFSYGTNRLKTFKMFCS